jgi:uncharacterized membrane protein
MGLGWFSIGLGLAEVAAPRSVARLIGLPADGSIATLRAFGAREIGNGLAILAQPDRAAWLWSRVGGDALDVSYLAASLNSENTDSRRLLGAIAAVMGVAALDVVAARRLNRDGTARADARAGTNGAVRVERAITINKPVAEVYRFWRQFDNFPRFMRHLESVESIDGRRSRWRAKGPAGMRVTWEAEILQDREDEWIAWRSVEGSEIENSGSVRFSPAPGARGTEVRVQLQYAPPAGSVGRLVAKLFGEEPEQQVNDDLRRVKQLMETGEIPISDGPALWRAARPPRDAGRLRTLAGVHS